MKKNIFIIFTLIISTNVFSALSKHDFSKETWSEEKSCLICHNLKDGLPRLSPPGSRVVDLTQLTTEEQAAYDSNASNVTCLVCHQAQHSYVAPKNNPGTVVSTIPAPSLPGSTTSGSGASTNIRVTNQGSKNLDCLSCHDLHNDASLKMLREDY